eukprot:g482.t1
MGASASVDAAGEGAGAPLPETLTREQARDFAGEAWDADSEAWFDAEAAPAADGTSVIARSQFEEAQLMFAEAQAQALKEAQELIGEDSFAAFLSEHGDIVREALKRAAKSRAASRRNSAGCVNDAGGEGALAAQLSTHATAQARAEGVAETEAGGSVSWSSEVKLALDEETEAESLTEVYGAFVAEHADVIRACLLQSAGDSAATSAISRAASRRGSSGEVRGETSPESKAMTESEMEMFIEFLVTHGEEVRVALAQAAGRRASQAAAIAERLQ